MKRLAVLLTLLAGACSPYLEPGSWGTARYFGDIEGTTPMRLIPPATDRDGNVYVLAGNRTRPEAQAFVGHVDGGWTQACDIHKGDGFGVHGWSGRSQNTMWYWAGDALVEIHGDDGSCEAVLDRDPSTGTSLLFRGIIPWVHDSPSKTTLVALIASPTDDAPYQVVVDLRLHRYRNVRRFQPEQATDVRVVGVGGDAHHGEGYALVSYMLGGSPVLEARFYDDEGATTDSVFIANEHLEEHALLGYLHADSDGMVAGLLDDGRLVVFDHGSGTILPIGGLTPRGLHEWQGSLYLVGLANGQPHLAPVHSGGDIEVAHPWKCSSHSAGELNGSFSVLDDRTDPSPTIEWTDPTTAIGTFPFLSEHSLDVYAMDTTGWIIAGPSFSTGVEGTTSVAFAPVGVVYQ